LARLRLKLFLLVVGAWSVGSVLLVPIRFAVRRLLPTTMLAEAMTGSSFHLAALGVGLVAFLTANVLLGYWRTVSEESAWQKIGRAVERRR
jgi:ABC-type Na+ efflux pump permease subunit